MKIFNVTVDIVNVLLVLCAVLSIVIGIAALITSDYKSAWDEFFLVILLGWIITLREEAGKEG